MKLLFDQNLSYRLVDALQSLYPGSQSLRRLGMSAFTDDEIWIYARNQNFTIVSKDSDFYYRSMVKGHPPKAIWVRLGNCSTETIGDLLRIRHADIVAFDQDPKVSFLVLP